MKSRFSIFTWLLGLAMVAASVEHASAAVYTVTNNQAVGVNLGLNPLTTYTHKLDFPGDSNSTAINGVQFSAVAGGAGVDPLTGRAYSLTMANPSNFNNGSFGVVDDFIHNGGQPANAVETLTLGGLTAGTVYDARLYYRNFGGRPNTVTVNTGAGSPWVGVLDQATASNENYQSIVFKADGATATLTFAQNNANASWHQYAVSTELVANPAATRAIHGLFPTGVNAVGVTLADGAADPHYSFISGPQVPGTNPQATVQWRSQISNATEAPNRGPRETGVGENIAGSFQWDCLANFPLGTESQRCLVILRWKSVIA